MPRDKEWDRLRSKIYHYIKHKTITSDNVLLIFIEFLNKFKLTTSFDNEMYSKTISIKKVLDFGIIKILGPIIDEQLFDNSLNKIKSYCLIENIKMELASIMVKQKHIANQRRGHASVRIGYTSEKRTENNQIYNYKKKRKRKTSSKSSSIIINKKQKSCIPILSNTVANILSLHSETKEYKCKLFTIQLTSSNNLTNEQLAKSIIELKETLFQQKINK